MIRLFSPIEIAGSFLAGHDQHGKAIKPRNGFDVIFRINFGSVAIVILSCFFRG